MYENLQLTSYFAAKTETFPPKGNKSRRSTLTTPTQHSMGGPASAKARKRNKSHPDWKRRNKIIPIGRQHKTPRTKKRVPQGCRMQGQQQNNQPYFHILSMNS